MKIGEFLQKHMEEKKMSQAELSRRSNIPASTISSIISRNNDRVAIEQMLTLCKILDCDLEEYIDSLKKEKSERMPTSFAKKYNYLDDEGKSLVDLVLEHEYKRCIKISEQASENKIIIYAHCHANKASAGLGYDLENADEWKTIKIYDCPAAHKADFAVEVDGDSMEPTYHSGDIVFIIKTEEIPLGKVGLFTYNGKGYIKEAGDGCMVSHNKKYDDIYPEYGEIDAVGRVIGSTRIAE